jgi:hypothetical protein
MCYACYDLMRGTYPAVSRAKTIGQVMIEIKIERGRASERTCLFYAVPNTVFRRSPPCRQSRENDGLFVAEI